MSKYDDLPRRDASHETELVGETAFSAAVEQLGLFVIQARDRQDYGTDCHLECIANGAATNNRLQVQIKSTRKKANKDNSVSIPVERTNLNYLVAQPYSFYVCYHSPSDRLLVRSTESVVREYEHKNPDWAKQQNISIRFHDLFSPEYQRKLHSRAIASASNDRSHRLAWASAKPLDYKNLLSEKSLRIAVPDDKESARDLLVCLYEQGKDLEISKHFVCFANVLEETEGGLDEAYLAEVNLAMRGAPFEEARIEKLIHLYTELPTQKKIDPGSRLYCLGNAYLALKKFDLARDTYNCALSLLDHENSRNIAAMCYKNMGAVMEGLGHTETSLTFFERALELDPTLAEAHFAAAKWHIDNEGDPEVALSHFDGIPLSKKSAVTATSISGWRIRLLFQTGQSQSAFREIQILRGSSDKEPWIWPWCAKIVAEFGKKDLSSAKRSINFWTAYIAENDPSYGAEKELLMCHWHLHSQADEKNWSFSDFESRTLKLIATDPSEAAFLYDRIGHWAQSDGDWEIAEKFYRKAFELEPDDYGYCLGTALIHTDRFEEALEILLPQANIHQPDALSWFQVAIAQEKVGQVEESISSYCRALELDPKYAEARFNLGGIFWNRREIAPAIQIWTETIAMFPKHVLSERLRNDLPHLFS